MNLSNFFAELKQRKLVQWTLAYVAAAFALLQGIDIVASRFGWPEQTMRFVIIALSVGLFVTLVLAWYHGERGAQRVTGTELLILALLLALGGGFLWRFAGAAREPGVRSTAGPVSPPAATAAAAIPEQSIAVLPFDNLSRDPDNAFFSSGIQDEILTRLAKIGALKVISRTSTQQYQSKPGNLSEIGKQLGVAHILEGSVQKASNKVHINVQLIKAATDAHVWAEIYDRKLDDIFAVEGEVATAIAEALNAKVTGQEKQTITAKLTNNPEAYDAYLRGLALFRRSDDASIRNAQPFLEQAVRQDPGFATAWALLAHVHALQYFSDPDTAHQSAARAALEAALRLQPELAEVQLAQGYVQYYVEQDYEAAAARFEQLLVKWPNNADILQALGLIVRRLGRWDQARAYLDRAVALDPLSAGARASASEVRVLTRDFEGALRYADEELNIAPDTPDFIAAKALIYQQMGKLDQAGAVLNGLHPKAPDTLPIIAIASQARLKRNYAAAISQLEGLLQLVEASGKRGFTFSFLNSNLGDLRRLSGDATGAQVNYIRARDEFLIMLKAQPALPPGALDGARAGIYEGLATTYCGLGDRDAALQYAQRAVELLPVSKDAVGGLQGEVTRAMVQARFGDRDRAIPALERLLKMPSFLTPAFLRLDPDFDSLRGDPRFDKLCEEKPK